MVSALMAAHAKRPAKAVTRENDLQQPVGFKTMVPSGAGGDPVRQATSLAKRSALQVQYFTYCKLWFHPDQAQYEYEQEHAS